MNDKMNDKLMLFAQADKLKSRLTELRPLNEGAIKRLMEEFIIENTYNSNAIEGNTLTLRETMLILKEDITIAEKPLKMHLEAIGHRDAFEYMLTIASPGDPLTEQRIKELHTLVMAADAANRGVYRSYPVKIDLLHNPLSVTGCAIFSSGKEARVPHIGENLQARADAVRAEKACVQTPEWGYARGLIVGAAHQPPQPYLVAPQMEALLADWETMKRDKHIIEAAAEFHLRFEGIHPFLDGNGRAGRLIINLELMKAGLLPVNIKFSDRLKYYGCFDSYFESNSPSELAKLIAKYEIQELERYIKIADAA